SEPPPLLRHHGHFHPPVGLRIAFGKPGSSRGDDVACLRNTHARSKPAQHVEPVVATIRHELSRVRVNLVYLPWHKGLISRQSYTGHFFRRDADDGEGLAVYLNGFADRRRVATESLAQTPVPDPGHGLGAFRHIFSGREQSACRRIDAEYLEVISGDEHHRIAYRLPANVHPLRRSYPGRQVAEHSLFL